MNEQFNSGIPEQTDLQTVFVIRRDDPPQTKNKDKIEVRFNRDKTQLHFAQDWEGAARVFDAINETKGNQYTVVFYLTALERITVAACDCPARKVCKHIVRAWEINCILETQGFLIKL